jgi:hypothetical protein
MSAALFRFRTFAVVLLAIFGLLASLERGGSYTCRSELTREKNSEFSFEFWIFSKATRAILDDSFGRGTPTTS